MANLKPGDVVNVYIYETLAYETTYTLSEDDFDADGDLDQGAIEETVLADGIYWNDCEVMRREIQVHPDA